MTYGKLCSNPNHRERDLTTQYRPGFGWLCAACHVDARTSSTRKAVPQEREQTDRYAALARKYGCY